MSLRERQIPYYVKAVNKANQNANDVQPVLALFFEKYVGQTVLKADGTFLKKIADNLPKFLTNSDLRICRGQSRYSVSWSVIASENDPESHSISHEVNVYVGELNDGVLTKVLPPHEKRRTDYKAEEVLAERQRIKDLQKVVDDAKSALFPFADC